MKPTEKVAYHSLTLNDTDNVGGRYARIIPRHVTGSGGPVPVVAPQWSRDLAVLPQEPLIDGSEQGLAYGLDVSGVGGRDGRTLEDVAADADSSDEAALVAEVFGGADAAEDFDAELNGEDVE